MAYASIYVDPPEAQYHYDIGYDGLFVHYRSTEKPSFNEDVVVDVLKNLKTWMDDSKKGIKLSDLDGLMKDLAWLKEEGFYLVNFETKLMSDFDGSMVSLC